MNIALKLFAICALSAGFAAGAQPTPAQASASAPTAATLADGEVRKVDKGAGKLTLRHGRIDSLDMPAMTMVFRVAAPQLLDGLKEGDKVRFAAERGGGAITITRIEPAK
ncbi:MAG: copper-binding protein [Pseudomonadota bacterium]